MVESQGQHYDVIVSGGGMVGLTAALIFAKQGFSVAVIEPGQWPNENMVESVTARVVAVNQASQNIFRHLGVWHDIERMRACAYRKMVVWDEHSSGRLAFNASDSMQGQLGHIIENEVIRYALGKAVDLNRLITPKVGVKAIEVINQANHICVTLDGQQKISSKLLVAADGARSWMRGAFGIPIDAYPYGHHALVTRVRLETGHAETAWQRFLTEGPLAFLPLSVPDEASIVWSLPPDKADYWRSQTAQKLSVALTGASESVCGQVSVLDDVITFPLVRRMAHRFVAERLAIVGDAAHTIHPLAGLGANMGFLDAAALVDTVVAARDRQHDFGKSSALKPYQRWRKSDNALVGAGMSALLQLFENKNNIKGMVLPTLRGTGMNLVNNVAPLKQLFMSYAMGTIGEQPDLAVYKEIL